MEVSRAVMVAAAASFKGSTADERVRFLRWHARQVSLLCAGAEWKSFSNRPPRICGRVDVDVGEAGRPCSTVLTFFLLSSVRAFEVGAYADELLAGNAVEGAGSVLASRGDGDEVSALESGRGGVELCGRL
jgi:hypothetical protein